MKVSNNPSAVGPSVGKVDSAKVDSAKVDSAKVDSAKVDSAKTNKAEDKLGLKSDLKLGGLSAKDAAKNSARVDVSERAQMMQKAKDIASNQTVDEAKVARLQKLIDEGKYKVDADKITDRLLDEHMNMPE